MRLAIREQLGLLVLFCCLFSLMVLAVATWTQNRAFVIDIRQDALSLTASLKSAQVSASLLLFQATVHSIATRLMIQSALQRYNRGNNTDANWARTYVDLQSAMAGGTKTLMLQAIVFPKNDTGIGNDHGLVNVTGDSAGTIKLPVAGEDGQQVFLGDSGAGYPPQLYPNLTYSETVVNSTFNNSRAFFNDFEIGDGSTLLLGPYAVNESFFLLSMTVPIRNSTATEEVLGWLTVILSPALIYDVLVSPEGLQKTGQVLLIGPASPINRFKEPIMWKDPAFVGEQDVRFLFSPQGNNSVGYRHKQRQVGLGNPTLPFKARDFPAVVDAYSKNNSAINNAGATISSRNEENMKVATGYATLVTPFVDWILVFEQSYGEVVEPLDRLRNTVLACVFGTTGLIMVLLFPLAHFAVRPIRQLRAATSRTVSPIPPSDCSSQSVRSALPDDEDADGVDEETLAMSQQAKKEGFLMSISRWKNNNRSPVRAGVHRVGGRRSFKIPDKVPERKHWIKDELSDLTSTFNEMSDELVLQYARLEERVKERTAELEESKKAAEDANASKTLFIANISHELKTPLNGILGMCTVCMQEEDIRKIRRSLGIIYKSGDLLLHLLTDLLTFSKNSIGQQLTIDETEFRLVDISTQVTSIFERQFRDGGIDLSLEFSGPCDSFGNSSEDAGPKLYGPSGTGRVRDMCLWGDKNRILQVLINLVSNSLKFTPEGGAVYVRIKCVGLAEENKIMRPDSTRKTSVNSKQSRGSRSSWRRKAKNSDTSLNGSFQSGDGADEAKVGKKSRDINVSVAGAMKLIPQLAVRKRSVSPPAPNTKTLMIELAVQDTGPGIPEDQMSKIFEPFVQGDLGLSKKYAGTGLGLSICAQLANLMGGGITLQSTVGIGSTFSVRIPLRYVKERASSTTSSQVRLSSRPNSIGGAGSFDEMGTPLADKRVDVVSVGEESPPLENVPRIVGFSQPYFPQEPTKPTKPEKPKDDLSALKKVEIEAVKKGEKVRVLVAEDNPINQEVVTRMLKMESIYDVTIAKDGQVALDMVSESMKNGNRFHLVFMDVQMPNLDGIQSTKRIREIGFSAPIVALTAFAEESNIKDCYDSGMNFFLPKPIRRPELRKVLSKYCPTIEEEEGENGAAVAPESATANKAKPKIAAPRSDSPLPSPKTVPGSSAIMPDGPSKS